MDLKGRIVIFHRAVLSTRRWKSTSQCEKVLSEVQTELLAENVRARKLYIEALKKHEGVAQRKSDTIRKAAETVGLRIPECNTPGRRSGDGRNNPN